MNTTGERVRRRGQPVVVMVGLLLIYGLARTALWQSPFDFASEYAAKFPIAAADSVDGEKSDVSSITHSLAGFSNDQAIAIPKSRISPTAATKPIASTRRSTASLLADQAPFSSEKPVGFEPDGIAARVTAKRPAASFLRPQEGYLNLQTSVEPKPDRWSLYGWAFLRQSSPVLTQSGVLPSSYGASQAGAVLRYRLAPGSGRNPTAYVRATRALDGPLGSSRETEAALGVSARLISVIPVSAHLELRAREAGGDIEIRPAAFAVTEFPPVALPLGTRGEVYAQAGYVGGEFATPFADGQARVTRDVASFRLGELRAGAGAWGGAQKGASRLDIGPSASIDFRIGPTNGRAQIDYRMRVAGDAEPSDGVAFTLSTGF